MVRSYAVIDGRKEGDKVLDYTIVIRYKGRNHRTQDAKKLSGYNTYGTAIADIEELKEHFENGSLLNTFNKNCDGFNLSKKQKLEEPIPQELVVKKLTGNALSRRSKGFKIKYRMYANLMEGRDDSKVQTI